MPKLSDYGVQDQYPLPGTNLGIQCQADQSNTNLEASKVCHSHRGKWGAPPVLEIPEFMRTQEEQHISQKVTHSSTFPCIAIASASLSLFSQKEHSAFGDAKKETYYSSIIE